MAKKITSYNQSGGITAENVNVEQSENITTDKTTQVEEPKKKPIPWVSILVTLTAIVSCIFTVLSFFKDWGLNNG